MLLYNNCIQLAMGSTYSPTLFSKIARINGMIENDKSAQPAWHICRVEVSKLLFSVFIYRTVS